MMRWIALPILSAALLLTVACGEAGNGAQGPSVTSPGTATSIPAGNTEEVSPAQTPDSAGMDSTSFGIYTMQPDGSDLRLLYCGSRMRNHAHVSPDGARVVFSEFNQDLNGDGRKDENDLEASDISVMDIDGSSYQPIAHRAGFDLTPVWSPDGRTILYSSDRDNVSGFLDLFTYDLVTQEVRNVTGTPDQIEGDPHWQGDHIVFNRLQDGVMTIWMMNDDGSDERQLTQPSFAKDSSTAYAFGDFDPKLAPDGASVAFERHFDDTFTLGGFTVGDWDIVLLELDSGETRRLVDGPGAELMPTWSPDGSTIAYWELGNDPGDSTNLFTVPAEGGSPERLLPGRSDLSEEMPDWYQELGRTRLIFSAIHDGTPCGRVSLP